MFGGLYGDLPDAKDAGSADKAQASGGGGGWSRPQVHVPAKRPAPAMPPSVLRAGERRQADAAVKGHASLAPDMIARRRLPVDLTSCL